MTCILCRQGDENRLHFVVQCQAAHATQAPYLEELLCHLGTGITDDELLLCIIFHPSSHVHRLPAADQDADMQYLETMGEFKYCVNTKCNTDVSVIKGTNAALEIPARCLC